MKKFPSFFVLVIAMLLVVMSYSSKAFAVSSPLTLMAFQINGLYVANGETYKSVEVGWTPKLSLGIVSARAEVAGTFLKSSITGNFCVGHLQGFISMSILPLLAIEGGAGLESWDLLKSTSVTKLLVTGNLVISLVGPVDRVFVGFSRLFSSPTVNEIRAGIGFNL